MISFEADLGPLANIAANPVGGPPNQVEVTITQAGVGGFSIRLTMPMLKGTQLVAALLGAHVPPPAGGPQVGGQQVP